MGSNIRKGNDHLTTILVEAAGGSVRSKTCHLADVFHRLRARMGYKKVIVAVARKLVVIIYRILATRIAYQEPLPRSIHEKVKARVIQKREKDLERQGYQVLLTPIPAPV